jgi:hypothetical protein
MTEQMEHRTYAYVVVECAGGVVEHCDLLRNACNYKLRGVQEGGLDEGLYTQMVVLFVNSEKYIVK